MGGGAWKSKETAQLEELSWLKEGQREAESCRSPFTIKMWGYKPYALASQRCECQAQTAFEYGISTPAASGGSPLGPEYREN